LGGVAPWKRKRGKIRRTGPPRRKGHGKIEKGPSVKNEAWEGKAKNGKKRSEIRKVSNGYKTKFNLPGRKKTDTAVNIQGRKKKRGENETGGRTPEKKSAGPIYKRENRRGKLTEIEKGGTTVKNPSWRKKAQT